MFSDFHLQFFLIFQKSHNDSGKKVTESKPVQDEKLNTSVKQPKKKKEADTVAVDVAALQASQKKKKNVEEETVTQEVEAPAKSKSKKVAAGEIVAQESSVDNPKRSKKSKQETAAAPVDAEELVVDESSKKSKKTKDKKAPEAVNDVLEGDAPRKKKKKRADEDTEIVQEVEAPVKKKKKVSAEEIVVQDSQVEKAKKPKKSKQEPDPMVVDEPPTKKNKKRKFAEVEEADSEKPKSKKRLNALEKLENPSAYQDEYIANNDRRPEDFSVPLQSQKLKKVIPPTQISQKLKKKRTKKKRVISEPPMSLPQPVWTTSGVFMEQPASPFKFMSTEYIPIKTGAGSTNFGVVVFKADNKQKKKVLQQQQPLDFKTQHMNRNKHIRDGSMKNLRGLIPK